MDRCAEGKRCGLIIIPADLCDTFPTDYCPLPASTYGIKRVDSGCELGRWLVPDGCLLPPPLIIFPPLLGRWERQSQKLALALEAKAALRQALWCMPQHECKHACACGQRSWLGFCAGGAQASALSRALHMHGRL